MSHRNTVASPHFPPSRRAEGPQTLHPNSPVGPPFFTAATFRIRLSRRINKIMWIWTGLLVWGNVITYSIISVSLKTKIPLRWHPSLLHFLIMYLKNSNSVWDTPASNSLRSAAVKYTAPGLDRLGLHPVLHLTSYNLSKALNFSALPFIHLRIDIIMGPISKGCHGVKGVNTEKSLKQCLADSNIVQYVYTSLSWMFFITYLGAKPNLT